MTGFAHKLAGGIAAMAMLAAVPAQAQFRSGTMSGAEKIRRLDIMLMVTGLRCRSTANNFQADFQAFEAAHMSELNDASRTMQADLAARLGRRGAEAELDRLSVTMANAYGNGHPWLGCADLKRAAHMLAMAPGRAPLLDAADEMMGGDRPMLAMGGQ